MKIKKIDSQRTQLMEGGGCAGVFGFPFFAGGVFLFLTATKVIPFENAREVPAYAYGILFFMGFAFVAAGGWLMFGRTCKIIDLTRRVIVETSGLIFPLIVPKKKEYYLGSYKMLAISHNPGDSDTPESFPVSLISKNNDELLLFSAHTYREALEQGKQLAQFIKFPLEDRTSDHKKAIESDSKRVTFRESWGDLGEADLFEKPMDMKSRVITQSGKVQIDIPGPQFTIKAVLPLMLNAAVAVYIIPKLMNFFIRTGTPKGVSYSIIIFILLILVGTRVIGLINRLIASRRNAASMHVDSKAITIEERNGWNIKRSIIALDNIVDIDYSVVSSAFSSTVSESAQRMRGQSQYELRYKRFSERPWVKQLTRILPSKGVLIKSKQGMFYFGRGLSEAEIKYLYSVVKRTLIEL